MTATVPTDYSASHLSIWQLDERARTLELLLIHGLRGALSLSFPHVSLPSLFALDALLVRSLTTTPQTQPPSQQIRSCMNKSPAPADVLSSIRGSEPCTKDSTATSAVFEVIHRTVRIRNEKPHSTNKQAPFQYHLPSGCADRTGPANHRRRNARVAPSFDRVTIE